MRNFYLATMTLFLISFANAQDVKFGIKGGLNLANLTNADDSSMKAGFHVGGFAEIKLDKKFAIQPEVLYSTQGAKHEESETDYTSKATLNLAYLNVPVMAKYYATEKLSIEAGPQIGFLLSAKAKITETYAGEQMSGSGDVKDIFKTVDFGVNFGAGYDITKNISAGVRYNLGLTQVQKELDGDKASKNSVFQFSVGYKF